MSVKNFGLVMTSLPSVSTTDPLCKPKCNATINLTPCLQPACFRLELHNSFLIAFIQIFQLRLSDQSFKHKDKTLI